MRTQIRILAQKMSPDGCFALHDGPTMTTRAEPPGEASHKPFGLAHGFARFGDGNQLVASGLRSTIPGLIQIGDDGAHNQKGMRAFGPDA